MNERLLDRLWQQILTFIATFASICLVAFIVRIVHDWSNLFSAFAISIFNGVFPGKWYRINQQYLSYIGHVLNTVNVQWGYR